MSIIATLTLANQAPLIERSTLRRPAIRIANKLLILLALVIINLALTMKGEAEHLALVGVAIATGAAFIWPFMEALRFDRERGVTGVSGLDAFIWAQTLGAGCAITIHQVMHAGSPLALIQIALIPAALWFARREIDRMRDARGFPIELDDAVAA